jgi:non-ribosomal peptide synthetase component F
MSSLEMASLDEPIQRGTDTSSYILQSQHTSPYSLTIPDVTTLPELFRWQAQRRGDVTLFSFRTSPDASLTTVSYSEAYEISSKLGNSLHSLYSFQHDKNPVVAIWLEKSIDLHLALLATTISGATWLPFDADIPVARVTACLRDSKACILLCDTAHYENSVQATKDVPGCRVVTVEDLRAGTQNASGAVKNITGPSPEQTAYMIYTSGSSGTPKGIEIAHRAALTFCLSERSVLETDSNDIVWQGFSAAFDMFIEEV